MKYEIRETGGVTENEIHELAGTLAGYIGELRGKVHEGSYAFPEAALATPFDAEFVKWSDEVVASLGTPKYVVLIGIGGSSAGTEAVYEAVRLVNGPELYVLEMADASRIRVVVDVLKNQHVEDIAIIIVSKSGTTTETLVNADVVMTALGNHFGNAINRRAVVVGNADTPLAALARERGMHYVEMPAEVGGRYSVFTSVGTVPLALLGVAVKDMVLGAATAVEKELEPDSDAAKAAALQVLLSRRGIKTHVLFPEDTRLHVFTLWYEQLLAESLGKRHTKNGEEVFAGMLPVPMSPRELHSTAQLYLSGFPGIFTTFLRADADLSGLSVSGSGFGSLVKMDGSRHFERIPAAIMDGVRQAYQNEHLPHAIYDLGELSSEALGRAMAGKMVETILAAHLLNIDAFDQPHVELYKKETKRLLSS